MFGWFSKDRYKVEDFSSRSSYSSGWTTTTIFGERPVNRREQSAIVGDAKELHKAMTEEEAVTAEEREALKAIHTFQKKIKVENCYPRSIDPRFQKNIEEASMQISRYPRKEELAEMIEEGTERTSKKMVELLKAVRPRVHSRMVQAAKQGKSAVVISLFDLYAPTADDAELRELFSEVNELVRKPSDSLSLYSTNYSYGIAGYPGSISYHLNLGVEINSHSLNTLLLDAVKDDLQKDGYSSYISSMNYPPEADVRYAESNEYAVLKISLI